VRILEPVEQYRFGQCGAASLQLSVRRGVV
jgi:hypothetical protein